MNFKASFIIILFQSISFLAMAQFPATNVHYTVSMPQPEKHYYDIVLNYKNSTDTVIFKMPVWTPGGYFLADHSEHLNNFSATNANGDLLVSYKSGNSSWTVVANRLNEIIVRYRIDCIRPFIDVPWVDKDWGLIGPTGVFLYTDKDLQSPVTVKVLPSPLWKAQLATGLETISELKNTFFANDFDILYDSPILMGNLEYLDPVYVENIPHYFIGYDIGEIDRKLFMSNLKKVITEGVKIIGDIPYKDYKFLSIGYGPGGIEHLNSCVVSFRSKTFLSSPAARFRNYKLLAHEYFHNYNVKRIRPIELGPFDYSGPNYTKLLWLSEGVTEYYANLIVLRSGLANFDEVKTAFQNTIRSYENKTGHLYQSLSEASWTVWNNSPFSKTKNQADSSISYYEKGCILGLLIDLDIRHNSLNKYSLDDVMRLLYKKYYQNLKRGFTDAELKAACESFAGKKMDEVFGYINTANSVNYPKYFLYAGLSIDTSISISAYTGFTTGVQFRDYLVINSVEENGPGWNAGLRIRDTIIAIQGKEPSMEVMGNLILEKKPGEKLLLDIRRGKEIRSVAIILGGRREKKFTITESIKKSELQKNILESLQTGVRVIKK